MYDCMMEKALLCVLPQYIIPAKMKSVARDKVVRDGVGGYKTVSIPNT